MTNTTVTSLGPVLITEVFHTPRPDRSSPRALDVETLDFRVQLTFRSSGDRMREWNKTARAYGALAAFVPGFDAEENRLYAAVTDHTKKDPALAKFQRDSARTARARLLSVLPALAEALRASGHSVSFKALDSGLDARFSRKAGCSCPCSPGFVLNDLLIVDGRRTDLFFYDA